MDFLNTDFNFLEALIWLVVVFLSIAFHEYCHGWAANELGDDTAEREGRLTLNPLKHIDPLGSIFLPLFLYFVGSPFLFGWAKPVPYNPYNLRHKRWGPALVALAGPAANFIIAVFGAILFRIYYHGNFISPASVAGSAVNLVQFFALLSIINISLAVFNLVPIPPLDGSKVLAAFLPEVGRDLFNVLERLGPFLVLMLFTIFFSAVAGVLGGIIFAIFKFLAGI